jgi:hypothetical protein
MVYVPPRDDVRVDLYDKDTLRSSVKVSIPNTNRVHVFDATATKDGRLIVSGCYLSETGQRHCFVGLADPDGHVSLGWDWYRGMSANVPRCMGERQAMKDTSRLRIKEIVAGRYLVFAAHSGYLEQEYKATKSGLGEGAILSLISGQEVADVLFRLVQRPSSPAG